MLHYSVCPVYSSLGLNPSLLMTMNNRRSGLWSWSGLTGVSKVQVKGESQSQRESTWFMLLDLLWISSKKFSNCSIKTRFLNLAASLMMFCKKMSRVSRVP